MPQALRDLYDALLFTGIVVGVITGVSCAPVVADWFRGWLLYS